MTVPRRTQETGGNLLGDAALDSRTLARLGEKVENGEKDIDELRKAIEKSRESQDRLEKRIEEDAKTRNVLDRDIYERLGSLGTMQRVLVTLTSLVLAALVGLAFMALRR